MDRFQLFSESRERLSQALLAAFKRLQPALLAVISRSAERAIDMRARQAFDSARVGLTERAEELPQAVVSQFNDLILKRLELESSGGDAVQQGGLLDLLPDADLNERIYANDLAQKIRNQGGEEYVALVTRIHQLTGFSPKEDRCPLAASAIAAAVVQVLCSITKDRIVWAAIRAELGVDFPSDIANAMGDINDELRAKGVLPDLPRYLAKLDAPVSRVAPSRGEANGLMLRAGDEVRHALQVSDASNRTLKSTGSSKQRALVTARVLPVEVLESEGVGFANALGLVPYSREARQQFFMQLRRNMASEQLQGAPGAIVDVVQSLFDYAVDENRIPPAAKPLLWRLQLPTITLSLLDTRYLGDDPRSMRRLVENLSAIVMGFPDDVFKGSELFTRLEHAVRAVEVVAHTLQTRAGVLSKMLDTQFAESADKVGMIAQRIHSHRAQLEQMPEKRNRRDSRNRPNKEAETRATERITALLSERMQGKEVPDSVRQFLGDVWLRRLRSAALRDGEESQEFKVSLQVVDDLLWSVSEKTRRTERRKLAVQIPPLIKQLTHGIRSVGADEKKLSSFFDELFLIHLRRMQRDGNTRTGIPLSVVSANDPAIPTLERAAQRLATLNSPGNADSVPVLGADLVLPDSVTPPALIPPEIRDLSLEIPAGRAEPQPRQDEVEPLVVPSLSELASNSFKPSSSPKDPSAKSNRTANATRVAPARAPVEPDTLRRDTQPNKVKIQGMEQLAAAASLKMITIPSLASGRPAEVAPLTINKDQLPDKVLPEWEASASEKKLLELLQNVNLTDGHEGWVRRDLGPDEALELIEPGSWLELFSPREGATFAKVAWINERHTTFLMVREHDRKALSLRSAELLERFAERRAFLLKPGRGTPPHDPR